MMQRARTWESDGSEGRTVSKCNIAGCKDRGRKPRAKECGWSLETIKVKEMNFFLEP